MIRQMPFKLPPILSVVTAVFNNDEAQPRGESRHEPTKEANDRSRDLAG